MIVKPYISFLKDDSDPRLIADVKIIIKEMTGNASYPTPAPALATVQTALDDFADACSAAAEGGRTFIAIKNAKRAVLVGLIKNLASYVHVTCAGNYAVLLSSGFPVQKPTRSPLGIPATPSDLTVSLGALSGQLTGSVSSIYGVAIYNWRITAAGQSTPLQTAQTTAASNTFSGLTPGMVYTIQANAVGSAGASDWSNAVEQMSI